MSNTIHFVLMGKGGVGKSFVASLLAQYLRTKTKVFCIDTDPLNPTFSNYKDLHVKHVNIMTENMGVDRTLFDGMFEEMLMHDGDVVIDNGASSFLPVMAFMLASKVVETIQEMGKKVLIHTPLVGDQGMMETINMLQTILEELNAPVVVWENEKFGPIVSNGKTLQDFGVYQEHRDRIKGIVRIEKRSEDMFGRDLQLMTSNNLTFDQVMVSPLFQLFPRQRVRMVQRAITEQLDAILQFDTAIAV